jgi:hypothetical protein
VGRPPIVDVTAAPRRLKPRLAGKGYHSVTLGVGNNRYVHRLVWAAWNGPVPEGAQVRHLDGNKVNNALDNLAVGTQGDNELDKERHGTRAAGERHGAAKLTADHVLEARRLYAAGLRICDIRSRLQLPVVNDTLRDAIIGETWKHLPGAAPLPAPVAGEGETPHEYLSRLLTHYAPQCQPLPDLLGLCSQIDNLLTGMKPIGEGEAARPSERPEGK